MALVRVNWCITREAHNRIKEAVNVAQGQGFSMSEGAAASNAIEKFYGDKKEALLNRRKALYVEMGEIESKLKELGVETKKTSWNIDKMIGGE